MKNTKINARKRIGWLAITTLVSSLAVGYFPKESVRAVPLESLENRQDFKIADASQAQLELIQRLETERECQGCDLRDVDFENTDLSAVDLSNAILIDVDFDSVDLTGANLSGADLTDADFDDVNLSGANLSGADLTDADLEEADLTNANLTNANLTNADLEEANLTGADVTGAEFRDADLEDVIGLEQLP